MNRSWTSYLIAQLIRVATLLAAISIITFTLIHLSPVDPVQAYIGNDMMLVGEQQRAAIAAYWGLDQPPVQQYLRWATAFTQGNWGTSLIYREPVAEVVQTKFVYSLFLMAVSWLLSGLIGFAAGIGAAKYEGRWIDRMISWYCYTIASTPSFWIGLVVVTVFAVWLGWFPIGLGVPAGVHASEVTIADRLHHVALPALTLSMVGIAPIALHTRQKLLDVMQSDYIVYARARGLHGWRLFYRHGLRNIALPALTLQLTSFSELLGGAVLIEQVFSYPGLGQATVAAGLRGDVPLLMAIVLLCALFVYIGNLSADLLYRWIDPRLRGKESGARHDQA